MINVYQGVLHSLINIGIPEKFLPSAAKEMSFLIAKETGWVWDVFQTVERV